MKGIFLESDNTEQALDKDKGDYSAKEEINKKANENLGNKMGKLANNEREHKYLKQEIEIAKKEQKQVQEKTGMKNTSAVQIASASPYADVFEEDNYYSFDDNAFEDSLSENFLLYHKSDCLTEDSIINEDFQNNLLEPVFIICSYTQSPFGKVIVKATHSKYSHSGLSFKSDLSEIYTFAGGKYASDIALNHKDGFSIENLARYQKAEVCNLCVHVCFLPMQYINIFKENIDDFINTASNSKYNLLGCLRVLLHKANKHPDKLNMFCSQFVTFMFEKIGVQISGKDSSITSPAMLSKITNPRCYKIFEGDGHEYNPSQINRIIKKVQKNAKPLKESLDFYTNCFDIDEWEHLYNK